MNPMEVALVFWLGTPVVAMAAPFCLTMPAGSTPQCIYFDGAQCAREATRQNGECGLNAQEVSVPPSGTGTYCIVTVGGGSTCGYGDGTDCSRVAQRQKGVCVKSAGTPPKTIPDPYAPNAGR
jgi:hypothetical protein